MMSAVFVGAFALIAILALVIPISLWYAFAASILWGWFAVPFGFPPLSLLQCWGVSLTLSMFNPRIRTTKSDPDEFGSALGACFLTPVIVLALGWSIKNWWM